MEYQYSTIPHPYRMLLISHRMLSVFSLASGRSVSVRVAVFNGMLPHPVPIVFVTKCAHHAIIAVATVK